MKTPHRMMREVLTDEEWARFLKNQNIKDVSFFYCKGIWCASDILNEAFNWGRSPEKRNYWQKIWERLIDNENTN